MSIPNTEIRIKGNMWAQSVGIIAKGLLWISGLHNAIIILKVILAY